MGSTVMKSAFLLVDNRDIEPLVPDMLSCIQRPAEVPETIVKLSGTTFVQAIEMPALAVLVPLLMQGLQVGGRSMVPVSLAPGCFVCCHEIVCTIASGCSLQ